MLLKYDLDYNSDRDELVLPEYGRHIQKLVYAAMEIQDLEERTQLAYQIVGLMLLMQPHNKQSEDFEEKIWTHLFQIANFKLDVEPPIGVQIRRKEEIGVPDEKLEYPGSNNHMRHYGNYVQDMIAKALETEEGPVRDEFVAVIAAYMKMAYKNWNKDHFVADEVIKADMETLSKGAIRIPADMPIDNLIQMNTRPQNNNQRQKNQRGNNNQRGNFQRNNNNNNNNGGRNNNNNTNNWRKRK